MKKTLVITIITVLTALSARAELKPYPLDTINGVPVYKYVVEKSIGLYRISINFGCTQEEILKLNPDIRERGLHFGETILVPNHDTPDIVTPEVVAVEAEVANSATEVVELADTTVLATDSVEAPVSTDSVDDGTLRLAMLLPLHAAAAERNTTMERFWDFYEGALLAIYDVQSRGQKIDVAIYDTEKSDARVQKLLESGELNNRQAIIGPAYSSMVNAVSPWAQEKQIPVLVPFTSQVSDIMTNPYLIRFNSSSEQEAEAIANYLSHDTNIHCVLVDQPEADIPEAIRAIRSAVKSHGIPYSMTTISQILADSLSLALAEGKENVLLLNTEKFANIQLLLPRIMNGRAGNQLTLLSQYSWQKEDIILPQIYATVFATEVAASTAHYDELYDRYFHHAHASQYPRYDLLGYDLTRLMLAQLMGEEYHGLQSDIDLQPAAQGGGLVNTHINIVRK